MLDRCWIDVRWTFDRFLMGFRWVGYVDIPRETESKANKNKSLRDSRRGNSRLEQVGGSRADRGNLSRGR